MAKNHGIEGWKRFAKIFNDTKKYPTSADVAVALNISYQTIRNKAAILRALHEKAPDLYPACIERGNNKAQVRVQKAPEEAAQERAEAVAAEIDELITGSKYPVINPEAIQVEGTLVRKYDREGGDYILREGPPRTWMTDKPRVAPIKDCRNKKFIFTGAQNDSDPHPIWENLKAYAKKIGAKLVVGPVTYEMSWFKENAASSRTYADELKPHLCFGELKVGEQFVFCGEMNTIPTASQPISDLVTYSGGRWAVFPHAKRQLKTVPTTDPNKMPHQVMTTGFCTVPKVIPRKAGIKSIFHHVVGAVIVEFDGDGRIFPRHISGDRETGAFYDLDAYVIDGKVTYPKATTVKSIVFPDLHERKMGPQNALACFGFDIKTRKVVTKNNVLDKLRPQDVLFHDIYDNETRNHHNEGDNAMDYELAYRGRSGVLKEMMGSATFLVAMRRNGTTFWVVESNHDLALERYVREGRYRNDGENIRLGLQLEDAYLGYREKVAEALDAHKSPPKFSVLEHAVRNIAAPGALDHVRWIYDGQSHTIDGIECGHHGFRGANGAKGTVNGFAKLGKKMSIGDKHTPEINEGVYVAGAMELQHGYNKGPSGWMPTMIVQYLDGKRTLVTLQDGKFRA
jgi:hypothetical protein